MTLIFIPKNYWNENWHKCKLKLLNLFSIKDSTYSSVTIKDLHPLCLLSSSIVPCAKVIQRVIEENYHEDANIFIVTILFFKLSTWWKFCVLNKPMQGPQMHLLVQ